LTVLRRRRRQTWHRGLGLALLLAASCWVGAAQSAEVRLAIAANFTEPARELAGLFEKASGHTLRLNFGATGQFYAQISQGAPFEVLLAADTATPAKAIVEGYGVAETAFVYATGRLVLYSSTLKFSDGGEALRRSDFAKLAIANPATAPYGVAAVETLRSLGLADAVRPKLVQGTNIAQTLQFIETGNAELGFVALSQVARSQAASRWVVPASLHQPIAQAAVLLKAGAANEAARAFLRYLKTPEARAVIEKFGYNAPEH
jgi:molybdate transport system substrate-binding protein